MVNVTRNFLIMLSNDPKRAIQKIAEATGDLIGNKIANKFIKMSRASPQNS